jgi:hypothetical protein
MVGTRMSEHPRTPRTYTHARTRAHSRLPTCAREPAPRPVRQLLRPPLTRANHTLHIRSCPRQNSTFVLQAPALIASNEEAKHLVKAFPRSATTSTPSPSPHPISPPTPTPLWR